MTPIHLLFLFGALPAIAYSDYRGVMWMRGGEPLDLAHLTWFHRWILGCLIGIIVTGVIMFIPESAYLLSTPAFLMKMIFVAALAINSFLIGAHMKLAAKRFRDLTAEEKET